MNSIDPRSFTLLSWLKDQVHAYQQDCERRRLPPVKLGAAYEHIAKLYGYRDWNTAVAMARDVRLLNHQECELFPQVDPLVQERMLRMGAEDVALRWPFQTLVSSVTVTWSDAVPPDGV